MSVIDSIEDRSDQIIGVAALYIAAASLTEYPYPWEIEGAGLVATAAVGALAVGYVVGGKIEDLLPDDEGIYIVAFEAHDDTGGSIYEVSEDKFDAAEVVAGTLFEWPVAKRVFECKEYRPEDDVIVGNWRESVASSQLAGNHSVADIYDDIHEIRTDLEPSTQRARALQRNIRSILRDLDRRRLESQQEVLDPTTNPSFNGESTVSEVIEEHMPNELIPESMQGSDYGTDNRSNGHDDSDTLGFEVLDDNDPLNPEQ